MDIGRRGIVGVVVVGLAGWLLACMPGASERAAQSPPPRGARVGATSAAAIVAPEGASGSAGLLLAKLPIAPHGPRTGYAREQFGHAWADVDRNGCDTRDDILRRDLTGVQIQAGSRDCVVTRGRLADPYTGEDIHFERGQGATVDIDHVVALVDAWVTGAAGWELARRVALANDPLNLLAVDASANRGKGGSNAADWLPPDGRYHCAYVARQIAVKAKYGLWVTAEEHDAMAKVLRACPDEPAPEGDAPTLAPIEAVKPHGEAPREPAAPRRREPAKPPPAPAEPRATDPDYGTCKAAKAHGAGPYRRGVDPEYAYYRDADGDGIVCE